MFMRVPGIAVLQRGVWQMRSMGVVQWADVPAFVLASAVRFRRGCAATDIWGRGGLGVRETRVKLLPPALAAREASVKPWRYPLRRQPRLQRSNLAPHDASPPRNPVASPAKRAPASFVGMNLVRLERMTENAKLVVTLSCPDRPGIVHAVTGVIGESGGNVIQSQQFGDSDTGTFFMRVEVDSPKGRAPIDDGLARVAEEFGATYRVDDLGRKLPTIIMVSREGHCLTDLLYRQQTQGLPIDVIAVVGNHPDLAPVAQFYGVPFLNIPVTKNTKAQAERQLLDLIASEKVELVVLARYMQILSDEVCRAMQGRVISIHHSFLPSFKGARPYAQAHERGVKLIGATAHYVTADLDEGPIIEQDVTRVSHADSTPDMVALGQDVERRVLAQAVRFHAERRVLMNGNRTVVFSR